MEMYDKIQFSPTGWRPLALGRGTNSCRREESKKRGKKSNLDE